MYLLACEIALITDRQKSVKNNVFHQYAHYDGLTRQTKGRRLNKCNSANTQQLLLGCFSPYLGL